MLYQRSVLLLLRLPEGMDQSYGFPVTLQNTEIFRSHLVRLLSRAIGPVDTPETLGAPEKLDLTIVNRATSVIRTALGPEDSDALLSEPLTPLEERYWTWESGTPPPGPRCDGEKKCERERAQATQLPRNHYRYLCITELLTFLEPSRSPSYVMQLVSEGALKYYAYYGAHLKQVNLKRCCWGLSLTYHVP
ncbi:hypothetical protein B0H13DRAFT_2325738 [Mycena leptocephala]|nr:hypothetical protein B0H13DRAFT_2325738 [Mycena leptocephala]